MTRARLVGDMGRVAHHGAEEESVTVVSHDLIRRNVMFVLVVPLKEEPTN